MTETKKTATRKATTKKSTTSKSSAGNAPQRVSATKKSSTVAAKKPTTAKKPSTTKKSSTTTSTKPTAKKSATNRRRTSNRPNARRRERDDAELDKVVGAVEAELEAFDPPYEAHKLRLAGAGWPEVAKRTGYPNAHAAASGVRRYLQSAAAEMDAQHKQEALRLAVDRHEAVLYQWWEAGTVGRDKDAAAIVLRTLAQLNKVLRLGEDDNIITKETVVISADPKEYVRQLQELDAARNR